MPNDQKPIKSSITRKQDLDNKPLKKAGDGTMGFMVWSIAGTVIAACSEPIFGEGTELTGGGGGDGVSSSGPQRIIMTDGRVRGADVYIDDGDGIYEPATDDDSFDNATNDAGYVNFDSLREGAVVFADANGAVDTATGKTLSGIWRSLPYSGSGDLIVSPVTNLLALRLEATPTAVGGEDAFYQGILDSIFGEFIVTVSDILDPDNYNVEGNTATQLVSRLAIGLTEIGAPTNAADSAGTLTEVQGLFATYRTNIENDPEDDAVVLSGTHAVRVNELADGAESRPVVVDPHEGNTIDMTEGTDFVLRDANSDTVSLFGFEDPQRNDDADGDGVREPGQLVGIYIEAESADGNIAVRFGDTTSSVALDDSGSLSAAERGVPSDGTIPADGITTIGGVTFFYVSAQNFGQLILRPDANFNTENNPNPEIRFYVYDGEDATVDVGGSLDRVGSLEIEVAAVDDLATAIALTGTVTTLAEDAVDSARVKVADIDITDGDGGSSGTLQLAGTNANLFQIDGDVLYLRQNAGINHETAATIEVRVQLSEDTSVSSPDLTITVTNVDEGDASFNVASDGDINAAVAGDVLTVSLATSDPDGDGTFAYQWQRDGANITGATSATYTIVTDDEDTTLTAVVMYTDGGSTSETVTTSGVTVRVPGDELATAIALDNQVTTLAENAVDSARVKVADIDITDGDGGQFGTLQLAGTDADEFEIDLPNRDLYLKEDANIDYDAGVTSLNVRVQLSEATSTGDDLTISITDVDDSIANADEGDASFNVASDGDIAAAAVGDVLTVSLATPDPDGNGNVGFTYQWHRGGTPINGATSTTYTIAMADEGTTLTVVVTYTDGGGTGETVTTSGVTVPAPGGGDALATAIALTGTVTTLAEDAAVTSRRKVADIDITDEDGGQFGTLERAGTNANLFQIEGTEIFLRQSAVLNHEVAETLEVRVQLNEDPSIFADLTITVTDVDEGEASFNVASDGDIAAAAVGDVLTVTLDTSSPADPDGNGDGTYTYQWHRDATPITGETSASYTIATADDGTVLTVAVSYTDGGGNPETVTTSGVTVRGTNALATAIALDNQVTTLAEDAVDSARVKVADIDITDGDGGLFGTLERAGADADEFEIDGTVLYLRQNAGIDREESETLEVRVQLSEDRSIFADLTITVTDVDEGDARFNVGSNADIAAAKEGDVLTVTSDASNPDPDGNGDGTFTYQWHRGGTPIDGATSATYTIARADEGTILTVVVGYTDGGGTPETVTPSGVTVPVDDLATAIALSNEVTMLAEDADVTSRIKVADITITDGDGGRSGTLERVGANANLFQIDGTELFLRQSAVLNHEVAETLVVRVQLSEAPGTGADLTITVTDVDEGEASFNVASDGDITAAVAGDVLTVSLATPDPDGNGDGTLTYQWHRDAAPITGETSATYTIVPADVGTALTVAVGYTDGGGFPETVTTSGVTVRGMDDLATAIALDNQVTTLAEDAVDSARVKVADIDITDGDGGQFGTLQLAGTDADEFEIDGTVLYLKEGANINYDAPDAVTSLNVRVQLSEDTSIFADLTITVTNVDEGDARFNVTSDGADINAAIEGDVLTVSSDASNPDPDGNGDGTFTYQWHRGGTPIDGATGATYTIARADEGTILTVVVGYTDGGGTPETVTPSGVTVPVDDLATAIALSNEVTMLAEDADVTSRIKVADITITDGDGGRSGTLERAGANANLFQIDGTELFLIQNAVLNHEVAETLVVRVQLSEAPGTGADLTISVTDVDEGDANFNVASDGDIAAAVEGDVLTVSLATSDPDGNGDGTLTYQWHRDAAPITGETSASYTIVEADEGTTLTVVVKYTDGGGTPETVTISGASVRVPEDALATAIALDNQVTTLAEDAVDSARVKVADIDITDGDGGLFGTLERAGTDANLFEIDGTVLYLKEGANINYDAPDGVTSLDVRVQLMEATGTGADLTISITNVDEGDARFNVASDGNLNAAIEGDVLTVSSDASNPDPDGNGDGTFTYQWHRGGTPIDGATGATYTIARADEGTILTVVVGYTDGGGTPETVTPSGVTVPVDDLATAIALSNEVTTLAEDADVTSRIKVADITITDGDGGRSGTLERAGANANLFQIDGTELFLIQNAVLNHEVAETLVVRVQLSEAPGTGADLTISVTDVDEGDANFNVASDGDIAAAVEGDVLTVSLATPDPDGNGDGTFTYQWQRDAATIGGATNASYTIVEADEGTTLTVVVKYTDGGGTPETVTISGASVRVPEDALATAIALDNQVTTLAEDAVDSARVKVADIDITDGDGGLFGTLERAGTDANLFEIDGTVLYLKEGANINYDAPDAVTSLNVRVQLSEATGTGADLTITVTNVDEGDARFNVASDGNLNAAKEGDVLTVTSDASNPDPDGNGDGTFTYQWHRGGTPIDGATSATYTIARADEGTILTVVVGYTDGGGTPETVTPSGVTVPVDDLATAIALSNEVTTLAEDADVTSRIKVADITITDGDGGRSGTLERAGANANLFQIDGTELFLIQNAVLNHEVAETLVVRVQLSEAPGTGADLTISVTDVDEGDANFNVASDGDIAAAVEGDVLTVSLATPDPDGNGDGTFTYQWQRDAATIGGATNASYTIVEADEGTTLTVVVKYTDGGGTPETVTISGASVRVPEDALATAIALDNQVTTLAEDAVDSARVKVADIDITDGDGGLFGTLERAGTDADEFEIDGTVLYLKEGANINYDAPDAVTSLAVRVQLSEDTGTGADLTISITNVDEGDARFNVGSNADIAAAKEGDVLTVTSDASNPDPDGNGDGTFTYQWHRGGTPIDGAISATYTIARADEGTILTVVVGYTDGGGTPETVTPSGVTVPVDDLATAIALSNEVTTLAEDADVTSRIKVADITITDGDGGRSGTLERAGANANLFQIDGTELFLIQSAGLNHETVATLVVRVQLSEAPGTGADLTISITNVDEGDASFDVTSTGDIAAAAEGDVLTVTLDASSPDIDGNGDGTFTYQWHRDGTAIGAATNNTYTIVEADEGTVLTVVVKYTDGGGTPETVTTSGVTVRVPADALATAIALDNQVTTLAEDAVDSARVKVADIDITDGDGGLFGTLERAGTNANLFEIDGTALYLKEGANINYDAPDAVTSLAVRVQLSEDTSIFADLTISITNVDEGDARFNVGSNADIAAAKEGDVLTVTSDASNPDPDGNGDGTFTYQWHRGGTPIDGATGATYTIARADEGTILTVVVGYTDGGGTPETVTPSGVTVPVDDLATAIALSNEVTMLAEDADVTSRIKVADITITDGDGGRSGTLERAGANANLFQIDGTELFLIQNAVLNHEVAETLVVRVQLSEAPGTGADLTISVTDVDEGDANFNVASDGDIAAAVEGDVLTVSLATPDPDGNGDGTFTYQWQRDAATIGGATNASYTIVEADEGTTLTVVVKYTDGGGTPETVTISGASVRVPEDALATAIALDNQVTTLAEDAVDSARVKVADIDITDGDGGLFGTLERAGTDANLFEIDGTVLYLKEGANINYDAPDAVTSLAVRVQLSEDTGTGADLTISITNVDEGDARFNVASDGNLNAAIEGDVLTVSLDTSSPDPDGNGTFTYQWMRDATPIASATGTTYTIARADEGTILTVQVTYTDGGGTPETVTPSGVTVPVDDLATAIALSNEVTTLAEDADVASRIKVADITITDGDGGRSGTLERAGTNANLFQIDGTELFLIQNAVLNHEVAETLVVRVQLSEAPGTGADLTISVTDVDEGDANFNVASDGDIAAAVEGDVLTVSLATPDPDGNGDGTFTYQWQRDAATIGGATNASYTIVEADEGTTLTVVVKYTDGGGTPETVTISGASVRVPEDALATAIALDNQVTTLAEDAVDSARVKVADIDITDGDDGLFGTLERAGTDANLFEIDGTVLYLKEGANIDFEAGVTSLAVRVQLSEATGTGADLAISITNVDEGDASFNVTSTGNLNAAVAGHVLTVSLATSDPDGDGTFAYRWQRDGANIASAISNTYTIVEADEGTDLTVVVSYTDDGGTSEMVETSGVSVPAPDAPAEIRQITTETTNGYYHLPATGQVEVLNHAGVITYSVNNLQTPDIIESRETIITTATNLRVTIDENGIWTAIPTEAISTFSSLTGTAERNFYIHAHDSGGAYLGSQLIEAPFNKMNIVRTDGNSGSGENEFFIGTSGDDAFSRTGGGTDVIVALEGDDTIRLGRNTSDTIYHRFSSSDGGWVNTDGGDTITNFNRNVNTFIFVDTDSSVVSESQFISSPNIRFFATIQTVISKILITKFEIRFSGEGSITFEYNAGERPDVTGRSDPASLAFLGTTNIIVNGTREITNHNVWSNYFGTNPDAFQVIGIDDDDLPPLIADLL